MLELQEIGGDETHAYPVDLPAGHYLHVVVDQQGIDVVLTLEDPSGGTLIEVDGPNGPYGPESLAAVAAGGGVLFDDDLARSDGMLPWPPYKGG